MSRLVILLIAVVGLLVPTGSAWAGDPPRQLDKDRSLEKAEAASRAVEAAEAEWVRVSGEIKKALDGYSPGPLALGSEEKVLATFREYVRKLLADGREVADLHAKWAKAAKAYDTALKDAPWRYQVVARQFRTWAGEATFAESKQRYLLVADTWEALAEKAEKRAKDFDLNASGGLGDFLKESNLFLERLLDTLDAVPRSSGNEASEYKQLVERLRTHSQKFDELKKNLKLFKEKVGE